MVHALTGSAINPKVATGQCRPSRLVPFDVQAALVALDMRSGQAPSTYLCMVPIKLSRPGQPSVDSGRLIRRFLPNELHRTLRVWHIKPP
jgi:hypothetical protein